MLPVPRIGAGCVLALCHLRHAPTRLRITSRHAANEQLHSPKPLHGVLRRDQLLWEAVLASHLHAPSCFEQRCSQSMLAVRMVSTGTLLKSVRACVKANRSHVQPTVQAARRPQRQADVQLSHCSTMAAGCWLPPHCTPFCSGANCAAGAEAGGVPRRTPPGSLSGPAAQSPPLVTEAQCGCLPGSSAHSALSTMTQRATSLYVALPQRRGGHQAMRPCLLTYCCICPRSSVVSRRGAHVLYHMRRLRLSCSPAGNATAAATALL